MSKPSGYSRGKVLPKSSEKKEQSGTERNGNKSCLEENGVNDRKKENSKKTLEEDVYRHRRKNRQKGLTRQQGRRKRKT